MKKISVMKRINRTIVLLALMASMAGAFFAVYKLSVSSNNLFISSTNPSKPSPQIGPITQSKEWNLILVNQHNFVPDDYETELLELQNGQKVDARIYPALQEMFDAARSQGVHPVVLSGYRTKGEQARLMADKIRSYENEGYARDAAVTLAESWVAAPGTSEHQLGLAVDINANKDVSTNEQVHSWLAKNAHTYGFILRYPPNKIEITGISHEPWHYRYVGVDAALEMYEGGLCLEEYIQK